MSETPHAAPAAPETTPKAALETEQLPLGKIALVGVGSVVIFAIGIWAATMELSHNRTTAEESYGIQGPPPPQLVNQPEQGMVNQYQFELEHRTREQLKAEQEHLGSYGWVDKQKKTVHIPIEEAMKQVVAEQKR